MLPSRRQDAHLVISIKASLSAWWARIPKDNRPPANAARRPCLTPPAWEDGDKVIKVLHMHCTYTSGLKPGYGSSQHMQLCGGVANPIHSPLHMHPYMPNVQVRTHEIARTGCWGAVAGLIPHILAPCTYALCGECTRPEGQMSKHSTGRNITPAPFPPRSASFPDHASSPSDNSLIRPSSEPKT
ncbi:hypothetical protein CC78DRAFT_581424 [Lojkania enalia]|uniref:Uncharacterized protein n=1 Tax=Lojkania enalia TaxID=147567 RepID=A0A9P4K637_9PLEO|nr:hypothetical protein CC78DRAFT_581424 [Didymosphaeria enalia]